MDSTCLALRHLAEGRTLHLLSFDYGQKHRLELERLDANLEYWRKAGLPVTHRRLLVPFGALADSALTTESLAVPQGFYAEENMKQTVVPNRNAIFTALCYAYALSLANQTSDKVELALGVHSGDHAIYPDCRREFFDALHAAFVLGNWNGDAVVMHLPYLDMDKESILRDAETSCAVLGLDFDTVLANTSTSYAPTAEGKADGKTGSDVERILAFYAIGRVDPVEYTDGWATALAYAQKVKQAFHM